MKHKYGYIKGQPVVLLEEATKAINKRGLIVIQFLGTRLYKNS